MKLCAALCCALLSLGAGLAFAGTTGKIAGTVKDAQSGEPVVGASVVLQGTQTGAATNVDGYYAILNISPGKYTMVVSAVGYTRKLISNVTVNIDLTTAMDVTISSTVVEVGEEVVATATRPLVQKDLTATTAIVNGEQIQALPVTEVGDVLALQAGYVAGSLRGGRSGEVAYWIDGVPVTDVFNGDQVVQVNKSLVQELQLVSGAYNAEYGQAMSGIVNIATKEGGPRFAGTLGLYGGDYTSSDKSLFPAKSFNPVNIRNIEGTLSGPVVGDNLTFFANGRYIYFGGWENGFNRFNPQNIAYTDSTNNFVLFRDPSGKGDSALVPMNSSERAYAQGKLSWKISSVMKLTGNYIFDRTKSTPYDRRYYFDPNGLGNDFNSSNTFIFQFSHTLNQSTFYTIGGSAFVKKFQHYLYKDPFDTRYVSPKLFLDVPNSWSFYTGGTDMNHTNRSTTTLLAKVDVTSQIDEINLVKAGIEYTQHKLYYDNYNLQPILEQSDINLARDNPFIQTQIPDLSSFNHDQYTHRPKMVGAYIQDKLEFKDLIINIGLRYDLFQPDGHTLADPTDPNIYAPIRPSNRFFDANGNGVQDPGELDKSVADRQAYWYVKAKAKSQLSPRLGFSFPITARGIIHFSYGHFFQVPKFEYLYFNPDFKVGPGAQTGVVGTNVVGNADLNPEETIKGEIGVQQQLTDDIAIDVTGYLSDIRGLTGTEAQQIVVFGGSALYSQYTNTDFGNVKGIILTVNKRFSGGFDATLDYTFQIARGSASDPQDAQKAIAGGAQPDIQINPLGWDQRHTLNLTAAYAAKTWGISAIGQYGSGTPYSPRRTTDITALLTNSQVKPSTVNLDLKAYYEFDLASVKCVAFARVFNVFDIRNEEQVYDDTGRAGFTLDQAQAQATNPNQLVNTLDQWFHTPTQYSEPRRIEFGLNLEF